MSHAESLLLTYSPGTTPSARGVIRCAQRTASISGCMPHLPRVGGWSSRAPQPLKGADQKMPDVPYPKPKEPTRVEVVADRATRTLDALEALAAFAVTGGSKAVSTRRGVLYVIAAIGIGIAMSVQSVIPSVVALVAVMLLALTDAVVEL